MSKERTSTPRYVLNTKGNPDYPCTASECRAVLRALERIVSDGLDEALSHELKFQVHAALLEVAQGKPFSRVAKDLGVTPSNFSYTLNVGSIVPVRYARRCGWLIRNGILEGVEGKLPKRKRPRPTRTPFNRMVANTETVEETTAVVEPDVFAAEAVEPVAVEQEQQMSTPDTPQAVAEVDDNQLALF